LGITPVVATRSGQQQHSRDRNKQDVFDSTHIDFSFLAEVVRCRCQHLARRRNVTLWQPRRILSNLHAFHKHNGRLFTLQTSPIPLLLLQPTSALSILGARRWKMNSASK
jgi:hypothetical protein